MADNKWAQFESSRYRLQDLGRKAVFLVPVRKLREKIKGVPLSNHLHKFLTAHFTAYTYRSSLVPSFGVWTGPDEEIMFDESRLYEVSFAGKDRIPVLLEELARVAKLVGEKCIYFEAGQYACLVWPPR